MAQGVRCKFETITQPFWALHQAKKKLSLFWQGKGVSLEEYRGDFDAYVATIESYGGTIGYEEGQIEAEIKKSAEDPNNLTDDEVKDARLVVGNGMLVANFVGGANNELYQDLKMKLNNYVTRGLDNLKMGEWIPSKMCSKAKGGDN